jgi:hypothetical protein
VISTAARHRTRLREIVFAITSRPALRVALFALLCSIYCLGRVARSWLRGRTRADGTLRFLGLAVGQFRREGVRTVGFRRQALVSHPYIFELPEARSLKQATVGRLWLWLADGLKLEGFYADAEAVYRRTAQRYPAIADLALIGLADIYLLHALWADEFQAYYSGNIALAPLQHLAADSQPATWHSRAPSAAADLLNEALARNPHNKDAHWLLANVDALQERWADVIRHMSVVVHLTGPTLEVLFQNARAIFAFDPDEGRRQYADLVGPSWRTIVRRLASSDELKGETCFRRDVVCEDRCTLQIRTHLVTRGQAVDIDHVVEFDRRHLYAYAEAEILPRYGMISVDGRWLLTDSAHVKKPHWPVFTTGLAALSSKSALLCTSYPTDIGVPQAIYIGNNNNYFHWIIEELPRLKSILSDSRYDQVPVLVPNDAAPWQTELLIRLGVSRDRHLSADFSNPLTVPYLVSPPRLAKDLVVHPAAVSFLREKLVPHHETLEVRSGRRFYLHRGSAAGRAMLNEAEVIRRFLAAGFSLVDPGRMSIDQQIDLFKDAEIIAGPGGAAFTNIIWAPKGAKIIALASDDILTETFSSIAAALGQEYWLCTGPSYPRAHRRWIWTEFNFALDIADVDACLASVLASLRKDRVSAFAEAPTRPMARAS